MSKRILVVAPHPDDEVLGCGGIIKRSYEESKTIYVLIVTRGSAKRYTKARIALGREQAIKAHSVLGVKETYFFEYPAPELDTVPIASIADSISELISSLKIDTLYIPHRGDIHIDHYIVFNAALVAARPVGNYTVRSIYAYETLSETEWAPPYGDDAFIPDHFVNIGPYFQAKLDAMSCYSGQLRSFPNPRSLETIDALARYRGSTVGFEKAEAFMTIRTIE